MSNDIDDWPSLGSSRVPEDHLSWGTASYRDQVNAEIERFYSNRDREPKIDQSEYRWGKYEVPRRYCVYVLDCDGHNSVQSFKRSWKLFAESDEIPSWAWAAYYASTRRYVGFTSDPYRRVSAHIWNPDEGALFPALFPAKRLLDIDWYDVESVARNAEEQRAETLRTELQDAFVYQQ